MFLKNLLGLLGLRKNKIKAILLDCPIHGSQYYKCLDLVAQDQLRKGQYLLLKRNPLNLFDERAIEVWTKNKEMLGHIPKKDNKVIATLLDQGKSLKTRIIKIENVKNPVTIRICLDE